MACDSSAATGAEQSVVAAIRASKNLLFRANFRSGLFYKTYGIIPRQTDNQ